MFILYSRSLCYSVEYCCRSRLLVNQTRMTTSHWSTSWNKLSTKRTQNENAMKATCRKESQRLKAIPPKSTQSTCQLPVQWSQLVWIYLYPVAPGTWENFEKRYPPSKQTFVIFEGILAHHPIATGFTSGSQKPDQQLNCLIMANTLQCR